MSPGAETRKGRDGAGDGVSPFITPLPTQLWAKVTPR